MMLEATKMAAVGALVGACALVGCEGESPRQGGTEAERSGGLGLALTVEGYAVNSVVLNIASEDLTPAITRERTLDVSQPGATVSAFEYGLPAGTYTLGLSANVVDDPNTAVDESTIACVGSVDDVVVTAGVVTQVSNLVLLCTVDGGQVRRAGGIRIDAELETESINQCPDLVQGLFVGPLVTSVGGTVQIAAELAEGASITWSARGGTFSPDGTQYTCPAIAGKYTLRANVARAGGCSETVTTEVTCHGSYSGSCEALPSGFAFTGACGLRSPCHVIQDGCSWQATCRDQVFSGEGEGTSFPFIALNGDECSASLVDGELVGTCSSGDDVCEFATNTNPPPVVDCEALPDTITDVTACGVTYAACDVVQDGCRYQANCDNGAAILNGSVVGDELQWNFVRDAKSFRCQAPIVAGAVQGSCVQRLVEDPTTCDDFAATVPRRAGPVCEESLPTEGFVVEGCGLEGLCFAFERGCAWEVVCNGVTHAGVASATNSFAFTGKDGLACTASVIDGVLTGSCADASTSCGFSAREPVVDQSCYQAPSDLLFSGCGWTDLPCQFLQDGCAFAANCNNGEILTVGTANASGVAFKGAGSFLCEASLNEAGDALNGQCTVTRPDGSVSTCGSDIVLKQP